MHDDPADAGQPTIAQEGRADLERADADQP